jgi:hypothetical protein
LDATGAELADFIPIDNVELVKMSNRWIAFLQNNTLNILDFEGKPRKGFTPINGVTVYSFAIADDILLYIIGDTLHVIDKDNKEIFTLKGQFLIRGISNRYIALTELGGDAVFVYDITSDGKSLFNNNGQFGIYDHFIVNQTASSISVIDFNGKTIFNTDKAQGPMAASSYLIFWEDGKNLYYDGFDNEKSLHVNKIIPSKDLVSISRLRASNSFIFINTTETDGKANFGVSYLYNLSGKILRRDTKYPSAGWEHMPREYCQVSDQFAVCMEESEKVISIVDRFGNTLSNFKGPFAAKAVFLKAPN